MTRKVLREDVTGAVEKYFPEKGYGFLQTVDFVRKKRSARRDDPAEPASVFFHISEIGRDREPEEGDRYKFDVVHTKRGLTAERLRPTASREKKGAENRPKGFDRPKPDDKRYGKQPAEESRTGQHSDSKFH